MEKAQHRQQEQDIIYERKLRKDREQEDHLYGDKDKYVSTSYKLKLMEQKKWEEEQAKKDAQDQDVTQKEDAMRRFHLALLNRRNVAAGSEDDAIKRDAERKREEELKRKQEEEGKERLRKERERQEQEREHRVREKEEKDIERGRELARDARRYSDDRRRSSERRGSRDERGSKEHEDRQHGHGDKRKHDEQTDQDKAKAEEKSHDREPEKKKRKGAVIDLPLLERPKVEREAPKLTDESAIMAARERYLARKLAVGQQQ